MVLVVFDYDWSLIEENSDTFIFDQLAPHLRTSLRSYEGDWTSAIDWALGELQLCRPEVTATQIQRLMAEVPVQKQMLEAVRLAAEQALVFVVSDANSVYIDSMVRHHQPLHFQHIFTNPAFFQPNHRLRVQPYHSSTTPHGCPWCPVNMCKGQILDEIRQSQPAEQHIVYVGDGGGDFCPAIRMGPNDTMFARRDPDKEYGLTKRIAANRHLVTANVVEWSTGEDIFNAFSALFDRRGEIVQ